MSWKLADEWIDLVQARHVVIFRNPDTGAEHQLIHQFSLDACPSCGRANGLLPLADFNKHKSETMAMLNAHHDESMKYREQHPRVRLGIGPQK